MIKLFSRKSKKKRKSFRNENFKFRDVVLLVIMAVFVGIITCLCFFTVLFGGRNYFKMFRQLSKFYDVYDALVYDYNGSVDKDKLIDDAIEGMVSSVGDVYTNYNSGDSVSSFDETVSGTYEGIGCTIFQDVDGIRVVDVYDDSPSKKAGLKADDIILYVDENSTKELGVIKVSQYIKNLDKDKVEMVIKRGEKELNITIERGKIEVPTVSSKVFNVGDKKIGYLSISVFSSVSSKQFLDKLNKLEKDKIDGLVIDVRGNTGGYLSEVTDILSSLLKKGSILYKVQKDKKVIEYKDKTKEYRSYPIAVLIDGDSASASEILAGAIKDSYHGYVVGKTSYGKGTVQQVKKLSDGSMIKYTVENWLTPSGDWINEKGIEPTHKISLEQEYFDNPSDETDNQLQEALKLVSE